MAHRNKIPSKHAVTDHYWPASETPFKRRFAGGPIVIHFSMLTGAHVHYLGEQWGFRLYKQLGSGRVLDLWSNGRDLNFEFLSIYSSSLDQYLSQCGRVLDLRSRRCWFEPCRGTVLFEDTLTKKKKKKKRPDMTAKC